MRMKWTKKILPGVLTLALCMAMPAAVTAADNPTQIAPSNVLNVQIVDKEGNPVDGVDAELVPVDGSRIAWWTSGRGTVNGPAGGVRTAGSFYAGFASLSPAIAPYEVKMINGDTYFNPGEIKTLEVGYFDDRPTAYTVPADTLLLNVDAGFATRAAQHYMKVNDTEYTFNTNPGVTEFSLAAGSYSETLIGTGGVSGGGGVSGSGSGASSAPTVNISSQPVEYVQVTIKLSELGPNWHDDGTVTNNGRVYSLREDTRSRVMDFAIVSGAVINAPMPDDNGNITFLVDKATRKYEITTDYFYNDGSVSGSGGGATAVPYTHFTKQNVTVQAVTYPDEGDTMMYVPAGEYTIKLTGVPAGYGAVDTAVTVTQSSNVQKVVITLPDAHTHAPEAHARVEATCTADGNIAYWYCPACQKYFSDADCMAEITQAATVITKLGHDKVHHDAQEPTCEEAGWDAYDTCTRCDYTTYEEIAAIGHSYSSWQDAGDGEHHECTCANCGDVKTEAHKWDGGQVTQKPTTTAEGEKTYTCTVCGATKTERMPKKAAPVISVPLTGDNAPMVLLVSTIVISGTALAALGIAVFKKKKADKRS